jgi:FtsP/CotA-like multicopper oxidase with cupredoxin domain
MAPLRRKAVISRRGLLAAGAGASSALFLASASRLSVARADATPQAGLESHAEVGGGAGLFQPAKWESVDLVEPEVRRSVDGELATALRVAYAYVDTGGYRLSLRTYEGAIPGPTLRVQPGDDLRVTLSNDLPPNRAEMPLNTDLPHHFNNTNVRVHGLHISPSGNADNVLRSMERGRVTTSRSPSPPTTPAVPSGTTPIITGVPTSRSPVGWPVP